MTLTSGGNVGIGVTPSAWDTTIFKGLQVNTSNAFFVGRTDATSQVQIGTNAYYNADGNWKYLATNSASRYYQTTGEHIFERAASGTAGNNITWESSMTITSGGNVIVGGTTAGTVLNTSITVNNATAANFAGFIPMTANTERGYFAGSSAGLEIGVAGSGTFIIYTNSTERMRITSGGALCVNATAVSSQGEILNVTATNLAAMFKTTGGAANNWAANFWNNATSGNNLFIEFGTETGYNGRGSVTYNRAAGLVVYNTTSDYRLKSEITDFEALSIIKNLKPKEFRIGDAENKAIGFIAHELQEFYPQAVHGKKDEIDSKGNPRYQGVDYSQLTGLLVKAIQEIKAEIEELKSLIK
jgi:hypothetical protein